MFWGREGGGGGEKKKRDSRYPLSFSLFLWLCDTPCLPKVWQIIFHNHWLPPISHIWFSLWHCESIMVFIQNSEIIQSQTQFNSSPVQFIKILESTQYIIKPWAPRKLQAWATRGLNPSTNGWKQIEWKKNFVLFLLSTIDLRTKPSIDPCYKHKTVKSSNHSDLCTPLA